VQLPPGCEQVPEVLKSEQGEHSSLVLLMHCPVLAHQLQCQLYVSLTQSEWLRTLQVAHLEVVGRHRLSIGQTWHALEEEHWSVLSWAQVGHQSVVALKHPPRDGHHEHFPVARLQVWESVIAPQLQLMSFGRQSPSRLQYAQDEPCGAAEHCAAEKVAQDTHESLAGWHLPVVPHQLQAKD
jgi:hypothetical protein